MRTDPLELCDVKCVRPQTFARIAAHGFFADWRTQALHGLAITGAERYYIGAYDGLEDGIQVETVERDEKEIWRIMEAERLFFEHVKNGTPPPDDAPGEEPEPIEPGLLVCTDERVVKVAKLYALMRGMAEESEECAEDAKAQLLSAVGCSLRGDKWQGGPEAFEIPGVLRATHRPAEGARAFDKAAAIRKYPDLAGDAWMKRNAGSRPFRVKLLGQRGD